MICRRSFGGTLATQAATGATGATAIMVLVSLALAWWNIKKLQIDQHRAWMLRGMFYLCTIITMRLIMVLLALITSNPSLAADYYGTMPCSELLFLLQSNATQLVAQYPVCDTVNLTETIAVVKADLVTGGVEQVAVALELSFGMAFWMALLLHAVGVEVYLALTPREGERVRNVSYERQMERGFSKPGSAGLTADSLGDAEAWVPAEKKLRKNVELESVGGQIG